MVSKPDRAQGTVFIRSSMPPSSLPRMSHAPRHGTPTKATEQPSDQSNTHRRTLPAPSNAPSAAPTRTDPSRPDPHRPVPTRPDPTQPDPTRPDPTQEGKITAEWAAQLVKDLDTTGNANANGLAVSDFVTASEFEVRVKEIARREAIAAEAAFREKEAAELEEKRESLEAIIDASIQKKSGRSRHRSRCRLN